MLSDMKRLLPFVLAVLLLAAIPSSLSAQSKPPRVWSPEAQPIVEVLRHIRDVPDADRGRVTRDLALKIRARPVGKDKFDLAMGLASRATEGDFGRDNLQEVTTTLAKALEEMPQPAQKDSKPNDAYTELASLVRYEHMTATNADPQYKLAMDALVEHDRKLQDADFTLTDTTGKSWNRKSLKGKVVLVNFWATWCPPCRKEMPDLDALQKQYGKDGFVVLGITDEEPQVVNGFLAKQSYNYPILFDPGGKANTEFGVEGIPKSFVYDRDGKLVSQSIDMRTMGQFREMLAAAGLK